MGGKGGVSAEGENVAGARVDAVRVEGVCWIWDGDSQIHERDGVQTNVSFKPQVFPPRLVNDDII